MTVCQHHSLLPYNTFGLDVKAAHFVEVQTVEELRTVLQSMPHPLLVLGGGSNVLFTQDVDGWIVKNNIRGIQVVRQYPNKVWVKVGFQAGSGRRPEVRMRAASGLPRSVAKEENHARRQIVPLFSAFCPRVFAAACIGPAGTRS